MLFHFNTVMIPLNAEVTAVNKTALKALGIPFKIRQIDEVKRAS